MTRFEKLIRRLRLADRLRDRAISEMHNHRFDLRPADRAYFTSAYARMCRQAEKAEVLALATYLQRVGSR